jgi:hypothetical protein
VIWRDAIAIRRRNANHRLANERIAVSAAEGRGVRRNAGMMTQ